MTRWLWNWEISLTILLFKCVTLGGKTQLAVSLFSTACWLLWNNCTLLHACVQVHAQKPLYTFHLTSPWLLMCSMVCTYITCVDSSCAAWYVHTSPVLTPHVQHGVYIHHLCWLLMCSMVCTYITCVDSSCAAWYVHTSPVLTPHVQHGMYICHLCWLLMYSMVCTYITCVDSSCTAWYVHTSPVLTPHVQHGMYIHHPCWLLMCSMVCTYVTCVAAQTVLHCVVQLWEGTGGGPGVPGRWSHWGCGGGGAGLAEGTSGRQRRNISSQFCATSYRWEERLHNWYNV